MDKLKISQAWALGETIVWSIFVMVNAATGLSMMELIHFSHAQAVWTGRVTLAFSVLALIYLANIAAKHRAQ